MMMTALGAYSSVTTDPKDVEDRESSAIDIPEDNKGKAASHSAHTATGLGSSNVLNLASAKNLVKHLVPSLLLLFTLKRLLSDEEIAPKPTLLLPVAVAALHQTFATVLLHISLSVRPTTTLPSPLRIRTLLTLHLPYAISLTLLHISLSQVPLPTFLILILLAVPFRTFSQHARSMPHTTVGAMVLIIIGVCLYAMEDNGLGVLSGAVGVGLMGWVCRGVENQGKDDVRHVLAMLTLIGSAVISVTAIVGHAVWDVDVALSGSGTNEVLVAIVCLLVLATNSTGITVLRETGVRGLEIVGAIIAGLGVLAGVVGLVEMGGGSGWNGTVGIIALMCALMIIFMPNAVSDRVPTSPHIRICLLISLVFILTSIAGFVAYTHREVPPPPDPFALPSTRPIPYHFLKEYNAARDPNPNCTAFGYEPLSPNDHHPRVIDLLPFSTDLESLEIRLNELDPIVDIFVILESRKTFTDKPKELVYDAIKDTPEFLKFKHKIVHIVLDKLEGESTWDREKFTRLQLQKLGLLGAKIAKDDIYILSDVDEMPRGSTLNVLKRCKGWKSPVCLDVQFFYYGYETRRKDAWYHPDVARYPDYDGKADKLRELYHYGPRDSCLVDAGWHCSSCFGNITSFNTKVQSFSHTEFDKQEYKSEKHIVEKILKAEDMYGRDMDFRILKDFEVDMPSWLGIHRPEKYRFLWDRVSWAEELGYDGREMRGRSAGGYDGVRKGIDKT
ncbi:hypothetical protein HK097_008139 [Rhizophlyctis rosea]|uniref:Uncharacterized protein n=1 Tax=Rhizophlyctis rosea TaxID=64517 RepID=A0AAD5SIE2_9FUNG|nr:hypothetical protein HK097_008139 [Rhizophlyctis rosea]